MFQDTVLRQKMHNRWAAARQKHQNDLCAKRRLGSAWASAQSDHSLRCSHGEPWIRWAHSEEADQTGWLPRLISVFAKCKCRFVGFVVRRLRMHYYDDELLLLQINTSIIAIATAAERKCRCVVFFVRRLRMHYNNNNNYYYYHF